MNIAAPCSVVPNTTLGAISEIWEALYSSESAKDTLEISLRRANNVNFTPASLMYAWAQENGCGFRHIPLGGSRLIYKGKEWKYDHWSITPCADGMQMVTLTLREA